MPWGAHRKLRLPKRQSLMHKVYINSSKQATTDEVTTKKVAQVIDLERRPDNVARCGLVPQKTIAAAAPGWYKALVSKRG
jgi:hypothetical protein